jgi:hypothetical protein
MPRNPKKGCSVGGWGTARALALAVLVVTALSAGTRSLHAQDNYEIQVYSSEMNPAGTTMFELHSNFTADGRKQVENGVLPTHHSVHETLEITHGISDWAEVGFYVFSSIQPDGGWQWVGDHIRPRFTIPERWHWPVGLSLSQEIGYQRRQFSEDTWTWEIRPIIDKKAGRWYASFNPTFDRALHGPGVNQGFGFSPNVKVSYDITKKIAGGLEYYGALGPVGNFAPYDKQEHQFFPTIDLDVSPKWEFNFGVGIGTTDSTDHLIVKFIVGRRFTWGHEAQPADDKK